MMNTKGKESKFKIIKHNAAGDGYGAVYKSKRNGLFKENSANQEEDSGEKQDGDRDEESEKTDNNSLKPFVEKLMSTPLHFMRFNTKLAVSNDNSEDKYIIIGDKHESKQASRASVVAEKAEETKEVYRPKSLAESLLNYIAPRNSKKSDSKIGLKRKQDSDDAADENGSTSATKKHKADFPESAPKDKLSLCHRPAGLSESEEKTPINSDVSNDDDIGDDIGEDLGDDIGEDLGEDLDGHSGTTVQGGTAEPAEEEISSMLPEKDTSENSSQQAERTDSHSETFSPEGQTERTNSPEGQTETTDSPEGQTAVSTPEADVAVPEIDFKSILKQKLQTPPGLEECSPITMNLASDHGSKFEPYLITKNWLCNSNSNSNKKFYPKGLINHGVTCYINSAVQAMLHIPAIQNYLMDLLNHPEKYSMIGKNSVTWHLAETSRKMWAMNSGNYYDPKKLISRLPDINCMMSEWEQEDSHEYFMSLMSRLQEDSVPKGIPLVQSIIYQIFGGKFKQSIKCGSCAKISVTEQMFYDLSVFLSKKKKTSKINLNDCVEQFFQREKIVDGYNCESCKNSNKNSEKQIQIIEEPEYLVIHLKKYKFDGLESHKMKQKVNFNKYLDLTPFKHLPETPSIYQLTSVVCHSGRSLSSGHYIAHTLQPDQTWATYDDDYINKISEADVLEVNDAYYLVYAKLTPKKDLCDIKVEPSTSSKQSFSHQQEQPLTPISKAKMARQKKFKSGPMSPRDKAASHKNVLDARLKLFSKAKHQKNVKKNKKLNRKGFKKF